MIEIDKKLAELILQNAPKPLVKCGSIVTTQWGGWKKPHEVRIYRISAEITNLNLTIGEREKLGINGFVGIELDYYGNRVNNDGEPIGVQGIVLSYFITQDGQQWKKIGNTFNYSPMSVTIEES